MTIALDINGQTYFYPETGDTNWGPEATDWAQAVTTGLLQKAGGLFILLDEVDFGSNFGLQSLYYKSTGASVSTAGVLRLAEDESIGWRNNADSANLLLAVDNSDQLTFNGTAVGNFVSVSDTNSIDLTLNSGVLSADLRLSVASATALNQLVTLDIQSDGLRAQIPNSSIGAAGLLAGFITTAIGDATNAPTTNGSSAFTIAAGAVSLAKMANLAANSIIGNNTGSPATPIALTATQTTAMLNNFVGDSGAGGTKGLVPAPASGDAAASKFLKADGTWATTPAGPSAATTSVLGLVFLPNAQVIATGGNGSGSTNTAIRRFTSASTTGTGITYAASATLGDTFTVTQDGVYGITYIDAGVASSSVIGISLNSNQLTTGITGITTSNALAMSLINTGASSFITLHVTLRLANGDVIRGHNDTPTPTGTSGYTKFIITQINRT